MYKRQVLSWYVSGQIGDDQYVAIEEDPNAWVTASEKFQSVGDENGGGVSVGENGGEVSVGEIQPISPEALKAELEEMRETLAAAQSRANAAEERATAAESRARAAEEKLSEMVKNNGGADRARGPPALPRGGRPRGCLLYTAPSPRD